MMSRFFTLLVGLLVWYVASDAYDPDCNGVGDTLVMVSLQVASGDGTAHCISGQWHHGYVAGDDHAPDGWMESRWSFVWDIRHWSPKTP